MISPLLIRAKPEYDKVEMRALRKLLLDNCVHHGTSLEAQSVLA